MDVVATGLWPVHLGIAPPRVARASRVRFGALAESNFSSTAYLRREAPRGTFA
jgi:hypothetical protein